MAAQAKTGRQVAESVARRMQERMDDPRAIWGLPWPFPGLNKLTGGIHQGEMTILAARPSVGKTTVMVQCADAIIEYLKSPEGIADHAGQAVKLVLCESTAEVFFRRWAALRSGVSQRKVQDGSIRDQPEKAERFREELRTLARLPIEVLDSAQSLEEILAFLRSGKTAWWALDYVQKCPLSPGRPNDGSVGPITLISGALTDAAKRIAPGLALAHTPREVDKREDRRPRIGDIKGGSALEGDARVVLGLYREAIYQRRDEIEQNQAQLCELLLLKQNEGDAPATIDLAFHPKRGRFEDISNIIVDDDEE